MRIQNIDVIHDDDIFEWNLVKYRTNIKFNKSFILFIESASFARTCSSNVNLLICCSRIILPNKTDAIMSSSLKMFYAKGIFVNKFTCNVINHNVIVIFTDTFQEILTIYIIYFKENIKR